jgi:hypothetical protein
VKLEGKPPKRFAITSAMSRNPKQPTSIPLSGGINNKIKTMKRQAYGYRDQKFFELKILALHDKNYAFSG